MQNLTASTSAMMPNGAVHMRVCFAGAHLTHCGQVSERCYKKVPQSMTRCTLQHPCLHFLAVLVYARISMHFPDPTTCLVPTG